MCNVTVDREGMEGSPTRNTELTSGEIKQLQQNMKYVFLINNISDMKKDIPLMVRYH